LRVTTERSTQSLKWKTKQKTFKFPTQETLNMKPSCKV